MGTPAADLEEAAGLAFDNLFGLWLAGDNQLKTATATFCRTLLPVFPESDATARPIADWLTLLYAQSSLMPTVNTTNPPTLVPYESLLTTADQVYRLCWLGSEATSTSPRLSSTQMTALLAAYNAQFG